MRLDFEFNVNETDGERRVIRGMGVPWGTPAKIGGRVYAFARGSLQPERANTPLLLGHDGEPVGVLAELVDDAAGALVEFKVDATPEGDRALVQAASGSRGSLSIGADVTDTTVQADGSMLVTAARYLHFALVPHGAFLGADVSHVAAEHDANDDPQEGGQMELDERQETPDNGDENGDEETEKVVAHRTPVMVRAERDRLPRMAGEYVALSIRAQHGEQDAARILAALTESISTDLTGLLPPTYERTVIGAKQTERPLYNAFRSRPLPGVGLMVSKPKWTTPPDGAWATSVDADATTSKVVVGAQTADVIRWDWAGAFPWVVVERSDPSVIDLTYAAAVEDFYFDVEAKIYGELGAAAAGTATTIGAALAEFHVATGHQRKAEVIIMAPDVWGKFVDASNLQASVIQGDANAADMTIVLGGVRAVESGALAAGETILATRRALDVRTSEPVRLTANAIGALNVELGVVGEGLFDTDYPAELLKFAGIVPARADAPASARSK